MIRVSVEIINGGARYELAVRAESIERAVRLAGRRFPGCVARVLFPIDPENFFAQADVQPGRTISVDAPKEVVG